MAELGYRCDGIGCATELMLPHTVVVHELDRNAGTHPVIGVPGIHKEVRSVFLCDDCLDKHGWRTPDSQPAPEHVESAPQEA